MAIPLVRTYLLFETYFGIAYQDMTSENLHLLWEVSSFKSLYLYLYYLPVLTDVNGANEYVHSISGMCCFVKHST